jgi:hypothetical protein
MRRYASNPGEPSPVNRCIDDEKLIKLGVLNPLKDAYWAHITIKFDLNSKDFARIEGILSDCFKLLENKPRIAPVDFIIYSSWKRANPAVVKMIVDSFKNKLWPKGSTLVLRWARLDEFCSILPELKNCPENFTLELGACDPGTAFIELLPQHLPEVPKNFSFKIIEHALKEDGHWGSVFFPGLIQAIEHIQSPDFAFEYTENGNAHISRDTDKAELSAKEIKEVTARRAQLFIAAAENKNIKSLHVILDNSEFILLRRLLKINRQNFSLNVSFKKNYIYQIDEEKIEKFETIIARDNWFYRMLSRPFSSLHSLDIHLNLNNTRVSEQLIYALTTNQSLTCLSSFDFFRNDNFLIKKKHLDQLKLLHYMNSNLKLPWVFLDNHDLKVEEANKSQTTDDKAWLPLESQIEYRLLHSALNAFFPKLIIDLCVSVQSIPSFKV